MHNTHKFNFYSLYMLGQGLKSINRLEEVYELRMISKYILKFFDHVCKIPGLSFRFLFLM